MYILCSDSFPRLCTEDTYDSFFFLWAFTKLLLFGDPQQFLTEKYPEFALSLLSGPITVATCKQFRVRQTIFHSLSMQFFTQYENKIYQTSKEVKTEFILTPAWLLIVP